MTAVEPSADPRLRDEITDWLYHEAELLDEWRLREWLDLVTDDIVYQVPIRVHKEQTDESRVTGVQTNSFHLDENLNSLHMRVDRMETGFAWAEEPPSRIRHVVSNVRVRPAEVDGELSVRSYVIVYRSRWDRPHYDIMTAERHDTLRSVDGAWKLARRLVVLDNTTIPMLNLTFFF